MGTISLVVVVLRGAALNAVRGPSFGTRRRDYRVVWPRENAGTRARRTGIPER